MNKYKVDTEDVPEEIEAESLEEAREKVNECIGLLDVKDIDD